MKIRGYALLGIGTAIGYVLGARAGRERYEQLAEEQLALWARKASDDLDVGHAVNGVLDSSTWRDSLTADALRVDRQAPG